MIRALGIFKRHKIPIEEKANALYLYMAGLSSWEIADMMEDHYGRKPFHSSVLNWARALGSVRWTIPPRERRLIAVDETVEKVNGQEVYVGRDRRGYGGAPGHQGDVVQELHGRAPLPEGARGARRFWAFRELGLERYHETFGDRSRVERSFGSPKGGT